MHKFTKLTISCFVFLAVFIALAIPIHEYEHCLFYWARGHSEMCHVLYEPLGTMDKDGALAYAITDDPTMTFYEHPIIWASMFAIMFYVTIKLKRWVLS